ncbi:dipeptide ABC transporter ATP-binding protein [Pseudonocardia ailaonensis]|uniref:Dipeptide ABC transporter ATP-binding protein n=1 Tax=Pseudonocardia ailaonensis TaxID=367279 RepID=A0ABN2MI88_9PSEU
MTTANTADTAEGSDASEAADTVTTVPVLEVEDVRVDYGTRGSRFTAVSGVSFALHAGETLGVVGESGCGKSSLGRAVLQLTPPTSGSVRLGGRELTGLGRRGMRPVRRRMQVVLQDPVSSLNPRRRIIDIVGEGLVVGGASKGEARRRAAEVLREVGMDPDAVGHRHPHEFSGGQCQRVAIARAMAMRPQVLVCDEPVASLDVSVQAQVLNLLADMKAEHHLAMLFISHDLSVVTTICDRVAVMYLGTVVEIGPTEEIHRRPAHPYTRILLDSVPVPDPETVDDRPGIQGELPSPGNPPSGCRFRTRCPRAQQLCADVVPPLAAPAGRTAVACHFPLEPGETLG